jgi:hypothetical protein
LPDDEEEEAQIALAIRQSLGEATVAAPAPAAAPAAAAAAAAAATAGSSEDHRSGFFCVICMSNFEPGTRVRMLPCFHSYCDDCITPWLHLRSTCPTCKVSINDVALRA